MGKLLRFDVTPLRLSRLEGCMGSGASKRPSQQSVQAYKPDADLAAKVQSLEKQLEASRAALAPKVPPAIYSDL